VWSRAGVNNNRAHAWATQPAQPWACALHHPLIAFATDCRMIANFWLRPANCASAGNLLSFLAATRANLGNTIFGVLRADSGFFADEILKALEESGTDYVVVAKLTAPLKAQLMTASGWWALEPGLELCEFDYQAGTWAAPRRMVAIRQKRQVA
jgi:Transposase DDE domain group 1